MLDQILDYPEQLKCRNQMQLLIKNPKHKEDMHILQKNDPNAFMCLKKLLFNEMFDHFPDFATVVEKGSKPAKTCNKSVNYYYHCITCKNNPFQAICQQCFNSQYHVGHNYSIKQVSGICSCGFITHQPHCPDHQIDLNQKQKKSNIYEIPLVVYQNYQIFVYQFFNIFLANDSDFRLKFAFVFDQIYKLNKSQSIFMQDTIISLTSPLYLNQNGSVLQELLIKFKHQNFAHDSIPLLFRILLSNEYFQIQFMQCLYKKIKIKNISQWKGVTKIIEGLLNHHEILAQLSKREIIVYQNQLFLNIYPPQKYWNLLRDLMQYKIIITDNQKMENSLIAIFSFLVKKYGNQIANSKTYKIQQFLYKRISSNKDLLQTFIRANVQRKHHWDISTHNIETQMFNMIVRSVLFSINGSVERFGDFFKNFDVEILKKFVRYYFRGMLIKKRKPKMNSLTVRCLYEIAKKNGFQKHLISIDEALKIDCLSFTRNLHILLRNLFCSDHLQAFQQMKTALYKKDIETVRKSQEVILQWFRDYLWSNKAVPMCTIRSIKQQGIIDFKQALEAFQKQTEIIYSKKSFEYIGQERKVNSAIYLSNFHSFKHLYDLNCDLNQTQFFYRSGIAQIVQNIIKDILPIVSIEKYRSYDNKKKEQISGFAIILYHILQKKNQEVNKYVMELRKLNQSLRKPSQKIISFFSLKKKSKKIQHVSNTVQSIIPQTISEQKIQQIMESPIKSEQSIESIDLQSSRKRNEKMRKIKQKFMRKSSKYSFHQIQVCKVDEQICLVCRQTCSKPKQKSFLFYLGSLKNDQISQFLLGMDQQKAITSCFHAFHQKCMANLNLNVCTLCKTNGNFILPVLNQDNMQCEYFAHSWWNDFLNLTLFTASNNSNNSYSYNSNVSKAIPTQQQKLHEQILQKHPFRNFLIVYHQLVSKLNSLFSQQNNLSKGNEKRIVYFYKLITILYGKLDQKQRKMLLQQIQEYQNYIRNSGISQYIKDLNLLVSESIKSKLNNTILENLHILKNACIKLHEKYTSNIIEGCIKSLQIFLNLSLQIQKSSIVGQKISRRHEALTNHIKIPDTMEDLYKLRQKCSKCFKLLNWHCLFCKFLGCANCDNKQIHIKNKHANGNSLILKIESGQIAQAKNNIIFKQTRIYTDMFGTEFNENRDGDLCNYKYSILKFNSILQDLFKRI